MKKKLISILLNVALILQIGINLRISAKPPFDDIPLSAAVHPDSTPDLEQKINDFEKVLNRYLDEDYSLSSEELCKICDEAKEVLAREPSLLRINGPTTVVGGIRANIGPLEYSIRKFLSEVRDGKSIIFLGNYVNKNFCLPQEFVGGYIGRSIFVPWELSGVKSIALLFKLKIMFPDKVFYFAEVTRTRVEFILDIDLKLNVVAYMVM